MFKKTTKLALIILISLIYCSLVGLFFRSTVSRPAMSANGEEGVHLPIVMYHSILKSPKISSQYIVSPSTLIQDIQYLKDNGYSFVSCSDLIEFVENGKELPKKPVMLTFDDGFYNNYTYVKQILREQDAKGVISVVGSYTDEYTQRDIKNMSYGYLRWSDINDLLTDEHIELANHSYNFHSNDQGRNGSKKKDGESSSDYKIAFSADTKKLQDEFIDNTGFAPFIYTYPFGAYSEESTDILKSMGFKVSLSCTEGVNIITRNPDCLFLLKRYNRSSRLTTYDFFKKFIQK